MLAGKAQTEKGTQKPDPALGEAVDCTRHDTRKCKRHGQECRSTAAASENLACMEGLKCASREPDTRAEGTSGGPGKGDEVCVLASECAVTATKLTAETATDGTISYKRVEVKDGTDATWKWKCDAAKLAATMGAMLAITASM